MEEEKRKLLEGRNVQMLVSPDEKRRIRKLEDRIEEAEEEIIKIKEALRMVEVKLEEKAERKEEKIIKEKEENIKEKHGRRYSVNTGVNRGRGNLFYDEDNRKGNKMGEKGFGENGLFGVKKERGKGPSESEVEEKKIHLEFGWHQVILFEQ